jgi:hypothetical protein
MQESAPTPPPSNPTDLMLAFEIMLQRPQRKSDEWQKESARLAAIVHNMTLSSETPDNDYLKGLALCRWAQTTGVIAAKNKNIQATRFRSKCPPPLDSLGKVELINAALDLMANLRSDWCKEYLSKQIQSHNLDKKGIAYFSKWAEKTANSPIELLEIMLDEVISSKENEKTALVLIKDVAKKINYAHCQSAEMAAAQLYPAVVFIIRHITTATSKKVGLALFDLLQSAVCTVKATHPTVVIHSTFVMAIHAILEQLDNTIFRKTAQAIVSQQIPPTFSVITELCASGGHDGISYSRLLLPSLIKTYPNFEKLLVEATRTNQLLQQMRIPFESCEENNLEDTATSIYARLLPTWYDFYVTNPARSELDFLNVNLIEAAKLNGIEMLEKEGDVVPFDAITHRMKDEKLAPKNDVKILKPTVIFRRANGTYRVVLPAIVTPV